MTKESLIQRLREEAAHDLHHETVALLEEAAQALAQPEQEDGCPVCGSDVHDRDALDKAEREIERLTALIKPAHKQEPVSMRMPKVGDKVVCIEDESLASVVSLTAGGSPDIVFSDGSRGTYLLREFAELFGYATPPATQPEYRAVKTYHDNKPWYVAQPEQEPVAEIVSDAFGCLSTQWADEWIPNEGDKLYTTPPAAQRKPLTDKEELSNGLAMALHDAVLIRIGKDDEATRQAIFRIDKLVAKYTNEAAHGIKENT